MLYIREWKHAKLYSEREQQQSVSGHGRCLHLYHFCSWQNWRNCQFVSIKDVALRKVKVSKRLLEAFRHFFSSHYKIHYQNQHKASSTSKCVDQQRKLPIETEKRLSDKFLPSKLRKRWELKVRVSPPAIQILKTPLFWSSQTEWNSSIIQKGGRVA